MGKLLAVIRREFVERVRTKAFIIGTIIGPIFFGAMAIIPGLLLSKQSTGQRIAVVDGGTSEFGTRVERALAQVRIGKGANVKAVYTPVRFPAVGRVQDVVDSLVARTALANKKAESMDGVLIVDEGAVTTGKLRYYGKNVGSMSDMRELETRLTPLMISERLRDVGVDPAVAIRATTPVDLETRKVTDGRLTNESGACSTMSFGSTEDVIRPSHTAGSAGP